MILLIAEDESLVSAAEKALEGMGCKVKSKTDIRAITKTLSEFRLILFDFESLKTSATACFEKIKDLHPEALLIAAVNREAESSIDEFKDYIYDYLEKPLNSERLKFKVKQAFQYLDMMAEIKRLRLHHESCSLRDFFEGRLNAFITKMSGLENSNLYGAVMSEVEKTLLSIILEKTEGNQARAAKILGINRNTLSKKIKEYIMEPLAHKGE